MLFDNKKKHYFCGRIGRYSQSIVHNKNTIVKKDPKMQKTSNLTRSYAGHLLTTTPSRHKLVSAWCLGKISLQVPGKRLHSRQPKGMARFVVHRGQNAALYDYDTLIN